MSRLCITGLAAACAALTGCATLAPDFLEPEVRHESHIGQHEPFTDHTSGYGRNVVGAGLAWDRGNWELEISEGYSVHGNDGCAKCPRESFQARLAYRIPLK